jgi:hypothetical protein
MPPRRNTRPADNPHPLPRPGFQTVLNSLLAQRDAALGVTIPSQPIARWESSSQPESSQPILHPPRELPIAAGKGVGVILPVRGSIPPIALSPRNQPIARWDARLRRAGRSCPSPISHPPPLTTPSSKWRQRSPSPKAPLPPSRWSRTRSGTLSRRPFWQVVYRPSSRKVPPSRRCARHHNRPARRQWTPRQTAS